MKVFTRRMRRTSAVAAMVVAAAGLAGASSSGAAAGQRHAAVSAAPAAEAPPPQHIVISTEPRQDDTAYVDGFSDVIKLRGSALLGEPAPAVPDVDLTLYVTYEFPVPAVDCVPTANANPECTVLDYAAGQLDYRGLRELPPATETFLDYGFVPVTATITLAEAGTSNCAAPGQPAFPAPMCVYTTVHEGTLSGQVSIITSTMQVDVSDVRVNGVPLDVGPGCHSRPFELTMTGSSVGNLPTPPAPPPQGEFSIVNGGTVAGLAAIPPFTDCQAASGENLAPLLDATISGSGNYVQLTEGSLCTPATSSHCPPTVPEPGRGQPLVSMVQPGSTSTLTCGSASHGTVLDGPEGSTDVGTVESFRLGGCEVAPTPESCTITAGNLPWPITATSYDPSERIAVGRLGPVELVANCTGSGGDGCTFEDTGTVNELYDYGDATLADFGSALTVQASTCPDFPVGLGQDFFIPAYTVPANGASP
jgi:hypothetical protein